MTDIRDGFRFLFKRGHDGNTEMIDTLKIFEPVYMPNDVAEVLSDMLVQQHEWFVNKESKISNLKALIEIVNKNKEIDKDVLITCIKYGMEYDKND